MGVIMVDELLDRVEQLTKEIQQVRDEICNHIFPSDEPHGESLFSQAAGAEVMSQFKAAVDDVRHVVWLYLEAVAQQQQPALGADPQRKLLVRATEILGALSPPLPRPHPAAADRSLLDRLLHLIENRIDPKTLRSGHRP